MLEIEIMNQYCENAYIIQSNLQIQCIPYQITKGIFHRIRAKILQFVWKYERLQIVKVILWKKDRSEVIRLHDFRVYYKATVIKIVWSVTKKKKKRRRKKERSKNQWDRIESPEINPCTY